MPIYEELVQNIYDTFILPLLYSWCLLITLCLDIRYISFFAVVTSALASAAAAVGVFIHYLR
jgi:hypothetical protein